MVWSNKGRVAVKSFFFRIQRTHCLLQIIAAGSVNYIPCKFIRASLSVFKTMAVPTIIFAGNPFLLRVQLVLLEKPLIVKLPRSCRRIGQLCLLMRPSKDKDVSWIASWMARLFSYSFSIGMRFFFHSILYRQCLIVPFHSMKFSNLVIFRWIFPVTLPVSASSHSLVLLLLHNSTLN